MAKQGKSQKVLLQYVPCHKQWFVRWDDPIVEAEDNVGKQALAQTNLLHRPLKCLEKAFLKSLRPEFAYISFSHHHVLLPLLFCALVGRDGEMEVKVGDVEELGSLKKSFSLRWQNVDRCLLRPA